MAKPIFIKVADISKKFRYGKTGSHSFRAEINDAIERHILRKKRSANDIVNLELAREFWALKDVSFDVKEGEIYGIVGKNGSGKSTLLKILSRIITPTSGQVTGNGRVSSLLEIGTGFHQELSGRENIYLSGNLLGMKKAYINSKFSEIVEFSGVGNFLDTPVKRYSSGMYVRLAFSIAAHLEPDILVVDEVLAVGDAEFQKKSITKMKDACRQNGRTIILVSHNMQLISSICSKALLLSSGEVRFEGSPSEVIGEYLGTSQVKQMSYSWDGIENGPGNDFIRMSNLEIIPDCADNKIDITTAIKVKFAFKSYAKQVGLNVNILLFTISDECIFDVGAVPFDIVNGLYEVECCIPGNFLNDGSYYLSLYFGSENVRELFYFQQCLYFDVCDRKEIVPWEGRWWGFVRPQFPVTVRQA